jgi:hypothetical protein
LLRKDSRKRGCSYTFILSNKKFDSIFSLSAYTFAFKGYMNRKGKAGHNKGITGKTIRGTFVNGFILIRGFFNLVAYIRKICVILLSHLGNKIM